MDGHQATKRLIELRGIIDPMTPKTQRCPECLGTGHIARLVADKEYVESQETDDCKTCGGSGDLANPGPYRRR